MKNQPAALEERYPPGPASGLGRVALWCYGLSALLAAILALSLTLAARAEALVYWVNYEDGTIGRANLDGTGVDQSFIAVAGFPGPYYGVALDDKHIFWDTGAGWIGRANLDGTGVDPSFIPTAAGASGAELALDDQHIYWSNGSFGWIGRARLNGTNVDQQLLAPQSSYVKGLVVDEGSIYWSDYQNLRIGSGSLSPISVNPLFIQPTPNSPEGLAVDEAHIYWSNGSADTIGRANRNGGGVDQAFIPTAYAYGVDVDDSHVFWANYDTNSIGRAKLNGSGADPAFIGGAGGPQGLAVDWALNPGAGLEIVKVKRNAVRGTAKLSVSVPGPGKLTLGGRGLRRVNKGANRKRVGLLARPKGGLKRKLATIGKAKANARVTFRPRLSEGSKTKTRKLRLKRN